MPRSMQTGPPRSSRINTRSRTRSQQQQLIQETDAASEVGGDEEIPAIGDSNDTVSIMSSPETNDQEQLRSVHEPLPIAPHPQQPPENEEPEESVIVVESEYEYSTDEDFEIEIVPTSGSASNNNNNDSSDSSSARVVPSSSRSGSTASSPVVLSSLAQSLRHVRQRQLQLSEFLPHSQVEAIAREQLEVLNIDIGGDDDTDIVEIVHEQVEPQSSVRSGQSQSRNTSREEDDSVVVIGDESSNAGADEHSRVPSQNRQEDNESSEDEEGEEEGPARKMPRLDTSAPDEDEGFTCQICYEPFTNSGDHRVCCLKCGHVYGKGCIERWINSSKRCPSCNCKAMKKDIRIIYVKNLKAADTAEMERIKDQLQKVMIEKNKIELSYQTMKQKEFLRQREVEKLQKELEELKASCGRSLVTDAQKPGPSGVASSSTTFVPVSSQFSALRMPKLSLVKHIGIKEGQSRVGAFNEWSNLYVVSQSIKSPLFPGGSYGIKKINSLEWKVSQSFPIHSKPLRDMAFSPLETGLLLTVGLDKKAILFNSDSNVAVQTFNLNFPLWSCCWNSVSQHIFYVGASNGQVTSYDIRSPREPLGQLSIPTEDRSSVARLKFVPPAYQNQSFNMSGLLIQKMNSVWMGEMLGGSDDTVRYFQLPFEGPFSNIDFEPSTRQVLVSCRPKQGTATGQKRQGSTHLICDLKKTYSNEEERDLFSCDVIQSITAGFQESSVLCRSALFKVDDSVYLTANGEGNKTVRLWDVSNTEQKSLIRITDDLAMDYVHCRINDNNFLGIITDKSTDIYDVKS